MSFGLTLRSERCRFSKADSFMANAGGSGSIIKKATFHLETCIFFGFKSEHLSFTEKFENLTFFLKWVASPLDGEVIGHFQMFQVVRIYELFDALLRL